MKTVCDLKTDFRVQDAEKRLKAAGLSDAWWEGLLKRAADMPRLYEMVSRETATAARNRRAKLAKKMRKLSADLENDPQTRSYKPAFEFGDPDRPYILAINLTEGPTLSLGGWLEECASSLEDSSLKKRMLPSLETLDGNSLKSYVIHGVFGLIDYYLSHGRRLGVTKTNRARNIETALIAGAVLGIAITNNDVTAARKTARRKNFTD